MSKKNHPCGSVVLLTIPYVCIIIQSFNIKQSDILICHFLYFKRQQTAPVEKRFPSSVQTTVHVYQSSA